MSARVLVIVSGSIAAYKACEVVSRLVQAGHEVRVVLTEGGARFVGEATWEGLCGSKVHRDLFEPGEALAHIELARWASLLLVCPASANLLNRAAAGLADDLAGALLLARAPSQPLLLAPAMNPAMWNHPATREAIDRLTRWGARLVPVAAGRTACGETGEGRMAEPAEIVAAVARTLAPRRALRVLVTSGGTSEPVDEVRVLTNLSSGHTGAVIARHLEAQGHAVTLVRAERAERAGVAAESTFVTFGDLARLLEERLAGEHYDAVIHAAAVGDFRVEAAPGKLASGVAHTLVLQPQRKLVNGLRAASRNRALRIVAFKLAGKDDAGPTGAGTSAPEPVRRLQAESGADLVVYNVIGERSSSDDFPAELFASGGASLGRCRSRNELAGRLEEALVELCSHAPVS